MSVSFILELYRMRKLFWIQKRVPRFSKSNRQQIIYKDLDWGCDLLYLIHQMKLLLLLLLTRLTTLQIFNFNHTSIINAVSSSGNLKVSSTPGDVCRTIRAGKIWIYHLSTENIFQRWPIGNLTNVSLTLNFTSTYNQTISDFEMGPAESYLSFLGIPSANYTYIYLQDQTSNVTLQKSYTSSILPTKMFVKSPILVQFYDSSSPSKQATIIRTNFMNSSVLGTATTAKIYDFIALSPSQTYGVIWTQQTGCLFYNINSMTNLGSYQPTVTPTAGTTSKIHFSQDQTLAVIQTDHFNPVVVLAVSNLSVRYQITVNDVIDEAYFLNSSNSFLIIFCKSATVYVNLQTMEQFATPLLQATAYTFRENYLYTCSSNSLTKFKMSIVINPNITGNYTSAPAIASNQTKTNTTANNSSSPTNSSTPNNSTPINQTNDSNITSNQTATNNSSLINDPGNSTSGNKTVNPNTPAFNNSSGNDPSNQSITNQTSGNSTLLPNSTSQINGSDPAPLVVPTKPVSTNGSNDPTQALNGTSSSVPSNASKQNDTEPQYQQFYVKDLTSFGFTNNKLITLMQDSLEKTSSFANSIANVASSTPIAIYLLACLNFISTSSLYVLLNFALPQQIYKYFSNLYTNLNQNILGQVGLKINVIGWSDEKIDRKKPLYFGITSDVLYSNEINFILFPANIIAILGISYLLKCFCSKSALVGRLIDKNVKIMIFGQVICLIQTIVLPWSFILLKGGVKDVKTKLNCAFYLAFFFVTMIVPFIYTLEMLSDKTVDSLIRLKQEQASKKASEQKVQKHQHYRFVIYQKSVNQQAKRQPKKSLAKLITNKIVTDWYLCQTNLIFPLLVLLQTPAIFLIAILCHNLLGLFIAVNSKHRRINNTLLAIYPIIFHSCFGIFYWCTDTSTVSMWEIVCLASFLFGSLHYGVTILFDMIVFVVFNFRQAFCTRKITPKQPHSNHDKLIKHQRVSKTGLKSPKHNFKALSEGSKPKDLRTQAGRNVKNIDQQSALPFQKTGDFMLKKIKLRKAREKRANSFMKIIQKLKGQSLIK